MGGNALLNNNNYHHNHPNTNVNSIDHLSMKLNKYDKIAIVGDNGGGKTTLTKLLLRFYNASKVVSLIDQTLIMLF